MNRAIIAIAAFCLLCLVFPALVVAQECAPSQDIGIGIGIGVLQVYDGPRVMVDLDCDGDDFAVCDFFGRHPLLNAKDFLSACERSYTADCAIAAPVLNQALEDLHESKLAWRQALESMGFCQDCEDCWDPGCCCYFDGCDCIFPFMCDGVLVVRCGYCGTYTCGWVHHFPGSPCYGACLHCPC